VKNKLSQTNIKTNKQLQGLVNTDWPTPCQLLSPSVLVLSGGDKKNKYARGFGRPLERIHPKDDRRSTPHIAMTHQTAEGNRH